MSEKDPREAKDADLAGLMDGLTPPPPPDELAEETLARVRKERAAGLLEGRLLNGLLLALAIVSLGFGLWMLPNLLGDWGGAAPLIGFAIGAVVTVGGVISWLRLYRKKDDQGT